MANKIEITEDQKRWLRQNNGSISYPAMAKRIGVCTDTLKRILVREGIAEFEGAKYTARRKIEMWSRPCINCKDATPRPKNLYLCEDCRTQASHQDTPYGELCLTSSVKASA